MLKNKSPLPDGNQERTQKPSQTGRKFTPDYHQYQESNFDAFDAISSFRDSARELGVLVPATPEIGQLVRCGVEGNERGKDGAYAIFFDYSRSGNGACAAAGWFRNWKTGDEKAWRFRKGIFPAISKNTRLSMQAEIRRAKKEAAAAQKQKYSDAAARAARIWNAAKPADPKHPYALKKQIDVSCIRQSGKSLLVPVFSGRGSLTSLQFILPERTNDGKDKFFLRGGDVRSGRFRIGSKPTGEPDEIILLCEGFATGATLYRETGYPVFMAFSAGNLESVAVSIRARYPKSKIVIAADNDHLTEQKTGRNPGIEAAKRAAAACGGSVAFPPALPGVTDFNDWSAMPKGGQNG